MTVAAFMDLALYDPDFGYYARTGQRSGRTGDFFTSVDVGPLFGELLAIQLREMSQRLDEARRRDSPARSNPRAPSPESRREFDVVEAGAGNGRLSADVLRAAKAYDRAFYDSIRLHLVEASAAARAAQPAVLGDTIERLQSSTALLPEAFEGVLVANELLDALPVHQVVMRDDGLREVFVDADPERAALHLIEGPPSTPALQDYLDRAGAHLEPGWRAEINLCAIDWIRDAARRLQRGFMILIDYGHRARELYSVAHSGGTLTTFSRHYSSGPELTAGYQGGGPIWLNRPGAVDMTAHVDFTSVQAAAEAEGLNTIALLDQTYFLLGLVEDWSAKGSVGRPPERRSASALAERSTALKTLIMPGGLGSTQKVLILGKNVGTPALKGCSFQVRMT